MRRGLRRAAMALCLCAGPSAGWAGDRSVTIIEGVPETMPPAPVAPQSPAAPPQPTPLPALALPNSAGLSLDMLPRQAVHVGEQIAFRVATRKEGYLLLFDIDAGGRVAQIYPSAASLVRFKGDAGRMNALTPEKPVRIPDAASPLASFAFRAAPPRGAGLILAALSDKPVSAVDTLGDGANDRDPDQRLKRLVQAIEGGAAARLRPADLEAPDAWSFATLTYAIE
jgi:hypothetical protein